MYYANDLAVISETQIDEATAALIARQFLPDGLPAANPRIVYAMLGIPGSGKSEYVDAAIKRGEFPARAFVLDPDRVMQALPAYQDELALSGKQTAYRHWEIPARLLAYKLSQQAAVRGVAIIQDMGGVRREDFDRLMVFKALGYQLHFTYVHCPVEECLRRVAAQTTRHTAEAMVRERDQSLRLLLPEYAKVADQFRVLDNSSDATPYRETTLAALGLALGS
jgi:predicted kinase